MEHQSSDASSRSDLDLTKTISRETISSLYPAATNTSAASLVHSKSNQYKSYEHHLRPSESPSRDEKRKSKRENFPFHSHHHHHSHHSQHLREGSSSQQYSMHQLAPDVVIEAIFNPHASHEAGPFTFVRPAADREKEEKTQAEVAEDLERDGVETKDFAQNRGGRWGFRGRIGRKDRRTVSTPVM